MLICLTASHKNASFTALEKLSVTAPEVGPALVGSGGTVRGAVVVATCNRFEAYLELDEPGTDPEQHALDAVAAVVGSTAALDADDLTGSFEVFSGPRVAEHLFAVSSGLESVVVGEGEIAGQVRRALEQARDRGTTTSELERLFQRASQTSRGVKARTHLGRAGRSLVRLGLELASSRIADWAETSVLVVGTGSYAGATLAALRDLGVRDIRVYSASGRAERFAASRAARAVPPGELSDAAADADVVITCTSHEGYVLGPDTFASRNAPARRVLVIDLGLPRNVDPAVAGLPALELLDLETIRLHAPLKELNASEEARAIVGRAARKFVDVGAEQSLTPAVVALRKHVLGLVDEEVARARARGDDDGRTEAALRHLAGVLLHTPSIRAREYARDGEQDVYVNGLAALFGLDVELKQRAIDDQTA